MSFRTIREKDASGRLTGAGYEWLEDKDSPGIPLYLLMWMGIVAAPFGVWVAMVGSVVIGLLIVAGGLALVWWGRQARQSRGVNRRALVFRTDDTIAAPHGLAGHTDPGMLTLKVSEIADVAFDVQHDAPYVFLGTKDGDRINVVDSIGLNDDDGRQIHAEITEAWSEICRATVP